MFVRFRQSQRRLQASLIETRRVDGKVRHEHIAGLGAIAVEPSIRDRIVFWQGAFERLAKLANRLDAATQTKIFAGLHARIPMVTQEEQRALQLENAEADERLYSTLHGIHQGTLHDNRAVAESIERAIKAAEEGVEQTAGLAAKAATRVAEIKQGASVPGGFGKPLKFEQFLRDTGVTTADLNHMRTVAAIGGLGAFEEYLADLPRVQKRFERSAARAFLRRLRSPR